MLIPGIPLEVKVEQANHTYLTYTTVNSIPNTATRAKVQAIINNPFIKVSKITINLS